MTDLFEIAKRRGFFWQSAAIHGGLGGFWDYGHIGTQVKQRWENLWRGFLLGLDDNFHEIQTSLVMPEGVFRASGHLQSFVDPVVRCGKCGFVERADQLIEEVLKERFEGLTPEKLDEIIKRHKIVCPRCKGKLEGTGTVNMMFPVDVGTGKAVRKGYLLPETAQGAYVNFKFEFEALRKRLPLGLAIIGKAFRNEISPRNALLRMREFTQAELQIFFDPATIRKHPRFKEIAKYKLQLYKQGKGMELDCRDVVDKLNLPEFYVYYMAQMLKFYHDVLKVPKDKVRFRELSEEEKAFYNKFHWDLEIKTSAFGFVEVGGCHYRTDHDLKGHQDVSGENLTVNVDGKTILCHVLELSFGVDRNILALMDLFLEKEGERSVLRLPGRLSPFDVGLFPLVSRDGLPEKALEVKRVLKDLKVFYDEAGSIGRRYRRMDEVGVSLSVTVDYQTLKDKTVTIRDRDSMGQVRVKILDLNEKIERIIEGEDFFKAGKLFKK